MLSSQIDIKRCIDDFEYYCANCLKIKSHGKIIPFLFNEPQKKIHEIIQKRRKENKLQRYIVLKARHEGVSTFFEAWNFHNAHMHENTRSMIMAHEKDSAKEIFQMCNLFYECLPNQMKPMTKYANKMELYFANPDPKTASLVPGMRSSLKVLTAGKDSVGRGFSFDAGSIHFSEVAFWPNPEDTVESILSIIPMTPEVLVVYESTANGVGNYFHEEWTEAEAGSSNFFPIFLAWFELERYSYPFESEQAKKKFMQSLDKHEDELVQRFKVAPEKLLWRRMQIRNYRRTKSNVSPLEKFKQEFPATPEEAFVVSGACVFDREKLRELHKHCKEPKRRVHVSTFAGRASFRPDEKGELSIWEEPIKDSIYIIGVDASGGESSDSGCIEVLKMLRPPLIAQQVAEWHGKESPVELASTINALGTRYNNALVAIEVYPSAHGAVAQNELLKHYYNIYRGERIGVYKAKLSNKYGWETDVRTKPLMTSFCNHCIGIVDNPTYVSINSKALIGEMMTYIRDGTAGNAATGHDDRVIAFMIALYVLHQEMEFHEPKDMIMVEQKGPKEIKVPKNFIDPEWMYILNTSDDSHMQHWTDY